MTPHTPIQPAPNFDQILRARLAALVDLHVGNWRQCAIKLGWQESTLYRRTNPNPDSGNNYRRLDATAVDDFLRGLDLPPEAVLSPVLLPGDAELLLWVAKHTFADPVPSAATYGEHHGAGDADDTSRLERLQSQGLLCVCGDAADPHTWYLRLTPAGQAALQQ